MPVVTPFVIPYVSLQPVTYATLIFFLLFRIRLYRSAAVSLVATFLIAAVFFAFAQTFVERPQVGGADALSRMVRDVYASDNPYNDFPSLRWGVDDPGHPLVAVRAAQRLGGGSVEAVLVIASAIDPPALPGSTSSAA